MDLAEPKTHRNLPTLSQIAKRWLAALEPDVRPMTSRDLARDLADKVLDGAFEFTDSETGAVVVETYTLEGAELSAYDAAFQFEAGIKDEADDRDAALAALAGKIRISPDGLERWRATEDFKVWAKVRGLPPFSFSSQPIDPQKQTAPSKRTILTKGHARKGGEQSKFNQGLQEAINRIDSDLRSVGKKLGPATFKAWITKKTVFRPPRDEGTTPDLIPYSFNPAIPNCDDLFIDAKKLVWTDRNGTEKILSLRSLEPYFQRAKART